MPTDEHLVLHDRDIGPINRPMVDEAPLKHMAGPQSLPGVVAAASAGLWHEDVITCCVAHQCPHAALQHAPFTRLLVDQRNLLADSPEHQHATFVGGFADIHAGRVAPMAISACANTAAGMGIWTMGHVAGETSAHSH